MRKSGLFGNKGRKDRKVREETLVSVMRAKGKDNRKEKGRNN